MDVSKLGAMRDVVEVLNNTNKTANSSGGHGDGYTVTVSTRGTLVFASQNRLEMMGADILPATYTLTIRYDPVIAASLTRSTRFRVNGKDFNYEKVEVIQPNRYYVFTLNSRK